MSLSPNTQFSSSDLRQVLGDFATGVTVLACKDGDNVMGMTANAFTSVSLSPPLVLVSIATGKGMLRHMKRRSEFSVSILSCEQETVARCYGSSKNIPDQAHWEDINGLPVIAGACAYFGCKVTARHKHGDHMLVVAEVSWIANDPETSALTFHRGQFDRLG